jgi:hypothetical protein
MTRKKRNSLTLSNLALSALLLGLFRPGFAGATDFVSLHAGSWFDAASTWGQSSNPGNGDNVEISAAVDYVAFDPSTSGLSVTVSNLYLYNGTLWVDSSPSTLTMAGTNSLFSGNCFLNGVGGVLHNQGTVFQSSAGPLNIGNQTTFENEMAGTYNLEGDSGVTGSGYSYFNNYGLLRKIGGNGISLFDSHVYFNNLNGVIEVDSGTLSLATGGTSTSGAFIVASGALLDLTGGNDPYWSGLVNGSGAGTVSLSSGTLHASPSLTLNLPDGLFQWTGGTLSGTTINANVITVAGSGSVNMNGVFYNNGLLHHTNTATLNLVNNTTFENQAGGIYNLEGDGGVAGSGYFNNSGLLRKSGGNGTSSFNGISFNNQNGSIEVDSGQLSLNGQSYAQGSGSFIVTLGGTNAGQFGQLVCGSATLDGPLQVKLAGGFVPAPGNQFQILSCSSLTGAFSSTNVPAGMSVSYSNNGVYLVVPPMQILNPIVSGGNLTFSFGTMSNQSYTVQRNDDLATTNWVFYTNFTGNGSLMQVVTPVTNVPMRFFRVWEP